MFEAVDIDRDARSTCSEGWLGDEVNIVAHVYTHACARQSEALNILLGRQRRRMHAASQHSHAGKPFKKFQVERLRRNDSDERRRLTESGTPLRRVQCICAYYAPLHLQAGRSSYERSHA